MNINVREHIVSQAPPTVFYIPEFISEGDENRIINAVNSAPKPKWTQLSRRRLQNWGGIPHPKGMIAEKMPEWLTEYIDKINSLGLFSEENLPNHVLVNEYLPGQGIMPHLDGSLFYPTVTTITCGSHTVLEFYKQNTDNTAVNLNQSHFTSLLLERRSLVILQDSMYQEFLHGISEVTEDIITGSEANLSLCHRTYNKDEVLERGTRISLTIRHVPKTTRLKIKLGR